jgi:glucokinase
MQNNMREILLADIGGTNSRFAVLGADGRPDRFTEMRNDDLPSMEAAFARYLDTTGTKPTAAVCGFAGPILNGSVRLTNRGWTFNLGDLASRFGFSSIQGMNDFEAAAWCLLRLVPDDIHRLGPGTAEAAGTRVILGPGTGLGAAALVQTRGGPHVVAGEGGNVSFGPANDEEEAIFARVRQAMGGAVSAERVISGRGLERLYVAMYVGIAPLPAREIVPLAKRGDAAALGAVSMFVRLLARYAGDLALLFKATGGVFITGGVARRVAPLLDVAAFRNAFEAHPPYEEFLAQVPTTLITHDQPGLLGCAVAATEFACTS